MGNPLGEIMVLGHDVVRTFMGTFVFKNAAPDDVLEPFKDTVRTAVSDFDIETFMSRHHGCSFWRYDNRFSDLFDKSISGGVRAFIAEAIYRPNLELLHELFPVCLNFEEFGWTDWGATLVKVDEAPYHTEVETTGMSGLREMTELALLETRRASDGSVDSLSKFTTKGFRTFNCLSAIFPRAEAKTRIAWILR